MTASDAHFAGSIPMLYARSMVPMLFAPYAADMAARAAALRPRDIIETAAGTGIVTAALAQVMPDAEITATDLNQAMLDIAVSRLDPARITIRQADAQALPFADKSFDLLVCQFGVMFFPDRVGAYREAGRVLRRGGRFLFNAWGSLAVNPVPAAVSAALAQLFPDNPPDFFARGPHGYHDPEQIEADLRAAGFTDIAIDRVELRCRPRSANEAALGFCHGSPVRAEIEAHGPDALDRATEAVTAALTALAGPDGIDQPMTAFVVSAAQ